MLEGKVIGGMGMGREGADHVLNEVVHAPVRGSHLNLGITRDLEHSEEVRQVLEQALLQFTLLPAVEPVAPAASHLTPEKSW